MSRVTILKNVSGTDIDLDSLGITILTGDQRDVSHIGTNALREAAKLISHIQAETIVVNDGTGDLTAAVGEIYVSFDVNTLVARLINESNDGVIVKDGSDVHLRQIEGVVNEITISNADGTAGDIQVGVSDNLAMPGNEGAIIPIGTTGERPSTPTNGTLRYNSTLNKFEFYENGIWVVMNDQDLWETITADTGSDTATSPTDILTIAGGTGISTNITGGVLTITSTAGSGIDVEENDLSVVSSADTINFEGNVTVADEGSGKATVSVGGDKGFLGGIYQLVFVKESSDVSNTWLSHYGDSSMHSSETFGVIPWKSKIIGLSFSNRDNDCDTDVKIYSTPEGGGVSPKTLEYLWDLRNCRVARKTNFLSDIILDAGDHIGVYLKDQGINPDYVVFVMYLQIIEETFEENVESFSGSMQTYSGGGSS